MESNVKAATRNFYLILNSGGSCRQKSYMNHHLVSKDLYTVICPIIIANHNSQTHQSATTLKPPTCDVNSIGHLITMPCSAGKPWVLVFMWAPLDMHHTSKHCCGQSTPPHPNTTRCQCPPQQDYVPWHTANTAQEQLEEHNKGPKVLPFIVYSLCLFIVMCSVCLKKRDCGHLEAQSLRCSDLPPIL